MANKQLTIVVALISDANGKLLAAKRSDPDTPDAHGKWNFIGGKIEFGEDPAAAIVREVKEESGLGVEVVRLLPKILTNLWTDKDGNEFQVIILSYECRVVDGNLHTKDFDHKILDLQFLTREEILSRPLLKNVPEIMALLDL